MAALLALLTVTAAAAAASATYIWGWNGEWTIDAWRHVPYVFGGRGVPLIDSGLRWTMETLERIFSEGFAEARVRAGLEAAGREWSRLAAWVNNRFEAHV